MGIRVIYADTLQHAGKHEVKNAWWAEHGIDVVPVRLDGRHGVPVDFGDYFRQGSNVVVDTKRNVDELARNISGGRKNGRKKSEHVRFREECQRAAAAGYRLVVLVENDLGYANAGDVVRWINGHCAACREFRVGDCRPHIDSAGTCPRHKTPKPIQGARLYKAMSTMSLRYGVRFEFCAPEDSARRVCELLGIDYD